MPLGVITIFSYMLPYLKQVEKSLVDWSPFLVGMALWPGNMPFMIYTVPKEQLFIGLLSLIAFIRLVRFRENINIKTFFDISRQPLFVKLIVINIIAILILNALSIAPGVSLFGVEKLQTGSLFWCVSLIAVWIFSRTTDYRPSFKPTLLLILFVSLLTILESLGFRPLDSMTGASTDTISPFPRATVGYKGHLAGLLSYLSLIPLAYYGYKDYNYKKLGFIILFSLSICALSCSNNTSALIGVSIAVLVFAILKRNKTVLLPILLFLVFIPSNYVIDKGNKLLQEYNIVKNINTKKDILESTTFQTRKYLWKAAIKLFEQKPLYGWGISTYDNLWYQVLNKKDGDNLLKLEYGIKDNQKFSRINDSLAYVDQKGKMQLSIALYYSSHNSTFDILYGQGIIGITLYAIFVLAILSQIIKDVRIRLFIIPILAYFIYLQAWFPTVTSFAVFAMFLGMVLNKNYSEKNGYEVNL